MDFGIQGKKALVTGGAQGIGQAISLELAKEGALVALTSRNQKAIDETLEMLEGKESGHYGTIIPLAGDTPIQLVYTTASDNIHVAPKTEP